MRTDHVIALEEGNYAPFPAPVYIRGSIRTYAKLLKLDVMKIMDDLAAEMNHEQPTDGLMEPPRQRRGAVDFVALQLAKFGWKRTSAVLLVLAVFALLLMIRAGRPSDAEHDPTADLPPPTYQPGGDSEGGYLPLPGTNR